MDMGSAWPAADGAGGGGAPWRGPAAPGAVALAHGFGWGNLWQGGGLFRDAIAGAGLRLAALQVLAQGGGEAGGAILSLGRVTVLGHGGKMGLAGASRQGDSMNNQGAVNTTTCEMT